MKAHYSFLLLPTLAVLNFELLAGQETKSAVVDKLDRYGDQYAEVARRIWGYAETGYQEARSWMVPTAGLRAATWVPGPLPIAGRRLPPVA